MNSLKDIFTKKKRTAKKKSSDNDNPDIPPNIPIIEVSETEEAEEAKEVGAIEPIIVKSIDLTGSVDVQQVTDELQNGNIVILNISTLMDENPGELKRAVDRLREVIKEIGGDIGRLSESRIITTPELVRIQFKKEA